VVVPINSDLLRELRKLQTRWECRIADLTHCGRGPWACGVLFGIEIARHRIAEDCTSSLAALNPLLEQWERISAEEELSSQTEPAKGVDFGIRLLIRRVRRYLGQPARRKPVIGDTSRNPPSDDQQQAGS
jgi:hypothetical protein